MLEKGIRVNCVAPGPVWTPLVVSSYPKEWNSKFGAKNVSLTEAVEFLKTVFQFESAFRKIKSDI